MVSELENSLQKKETKTTLSPYPENILNRIKTTCQEEIISITVNTKK
jgi:hypothetical protein